jgi:hypothetical protein
MAWSVGSISGSFLKVLATLLLLPTALSMTARARAGDVLDLNVTNSEGVYRIEVEMRVHAPFEAVWQVLTDYAHIYRLNNSIVESKILPAPEQNVVRVRTLMNDCVFVFCFEIDRVDDIRMKDNGRLQAVLVDEMSNIKSGTAVWWIQPAGENSDIHYKGTIEPGFQVLPLIGDWFTRTKLRRMTLSTLENLERISRIRSGRDVGPESAVVFSGPP